MGGTWSINPENGRGSASLFGPPGLMGSEKLKKSFRPCYRQPLSRIGRPNELKIWFVGKCASWWEGGTGSLRGPPHKILRATDVLGEYLEQSPYCLVNPQAQEGWGWPTSQKVLVAELDLELLGVLIPILMSHDK